MSIEVPISPLEVARALSEKLQAALQSSIPGFTVLPEPLNRRDRPRGHRNLPDRFFEALAVAIEKSPEFAGAVRVTSAQIREMLQFCAAFLALANDLERFARGIRYLVGTRRANVGRLASSAYRIAKAMNVLVNLGPPVPQVTEMQEAIKERRRKSTDEKSPPETDLEPLKAVPRSSKAT